MKVDMVCVVPYRYVDQKLQILVLQRNPADGIGDDFWQMVSGTHEEEEWSPIAAIREVEEETGLKPKNLVEIDFIHRIWLRKQDIIIWGPAFACELDVGEVVLSNEHVAYLWLSPEDALNKLPRSSQRGVLTQFLQDSINSGRMKEFTMWTREGGWTLFKPPQGMIERGF